MATAGSCAKAAEPKQRCRTAWPTTEWLARQQRSRGNWIDGRRRNVSAATAAATTTTPDGFAFPTCCLRRQSLHFRPDAPASQRDTRWAIHGRPVGPALNNRRHHQLASDIRPSGQREREFRPQVLHLCGACGRTTTADYDRWPEGRKWARFIIQLGGRSANYDAPAAWLSLRKPENRALSGSLDSTQLISSRLDSTLLMPHG